ncbi:MAG: class I adenylate-forming enzyme family protein [Acidimicrobiales bacterium]
MRPLDWRAHLAGPTDPEPSGRGLPAGAAGGSVGSVAGWTTDVDVTAGGTLPRVFAARWSSEPGASSLFIANGEGDAADNRRWVTAGELDERTRHVASGLLHLGLPRHARVLWNADRSLASVVAGVAVLRAGLVLVPLDPKLTERELLHVVDEVRPDLAIVDDPGRGAVIGRMLAGAAGDGSVIDTSFAGVGSTEPSDGIDESGPDDPALIGFTSGTTGAPKGAVLTHANLLANAESLRLAWRWTSGDRLVLALPLFHGHGLCAGLFGSLNAGGSVVLMGGFDSGAVVDAVAEHRGTLFFGVPTMYHRFASSGHASGLGRLRLCVSGSAPLLPELHREIERASGMSVLERYGMTETLLTVSNPLYGERRPGSIGFPLPGTEVVLSATGGDSEGAELLVRGPTVFAGYFDKPAQTAERFNGEWFTTGDIGVVEDGYIRLLGRVTEVVISGGHNVYPAEVEDVLSRFSDVAEVAVSGTPSDEWGEVVTAWVVSRSGRLDVEGLLSYAAEGLAPYKRPRIVRQVDSLPRNSMGKVMRRSLV